MTIGSLNKRIDIQAQTKTTDGAGGFPTVWVSVLPTGTKIAAAIWPVSANEVIQAQAATLITTHRIRIRYRSVMKSGWRIVYGARNFNIVSIVNPNMDCKWLDILCKEAG